PPGRDLPTGRRSPHVAATAMNTKEIVLGLGPQNSLWSVAHLAEEQLRAAHGAPRKVIAQANGVEMEASRPQFDGEFEGFTVRLRGAVGPVKEAAREVAAHAAAPCEVVEKDGTLELLCPGPASARAMPEQVHQTCDALSARLRLPEIWRVQGRGYRLDPISPEALFRLMIKFKASDVHIYPGSPPVFRVDNILRRCQTSDLLSAEQIFALVQDMAPARDWHAFQERQQCSFIYHQVG